MKKKLLFVIPYLGNGGAEKVMLTLLNNLSRNKYELHICLIKGRGNYFTQLKQDVHVHVLNAGSVQLAFFKIYSCIKKIDPDIVFGCLSFLIVPLGIMKRMFFRKKIFIARETGIPSIRKSIFAINNKFFCTISYRQMDTVICQCRYQRDEVISYYKVPSSRTTVIPNPTQCDGTLPEKQRQPGDKIHLVSAGSLEKRKNHYAAIKAVKLCADKSITLHIYGEGSLKLALTKYIEANNLRDRVVLHGFALGLSKELYKYDAYVMTSYSEPCSNALLEAQAHGLPAIAFESPGATSEIIINNKTGFLVPDYDIEKLSRIISDKQYLALDRDIIKKSIKSRFDLALSIKKYGDLFDSFT